MSKGTPLPASVIEKPVPSKSITIGEVSIPSGQLQKSESYPVGPAHRFRNALLRVQGPPKISPVMQPVDGYVVQSAAAAQVPATRTPQGKRAKLLRIVSVQKVPSLLWHRTDESWLRALR